MATIRNESEIKLRYLFFLDIETKRIDLFLNCQNRKEAKRDRSETCLKQIEDKPSCLKKSKNENKLIPYHFRSKEKRVEVLQ